MWKRLFRSKPNWEDWEEKMIVDVCGRINSASQPYRRKVFIDCGFNTCRVLAKFEQNLAPDFEIFGFDILEELAPAAQNFERNHPGRVCRLEIAAVSDHDGTQPFFEVTEWGPNYKGGSSVMNSYLPQRRQGLEPKPVRSIDFSNWLLRTFAKDDYIAIKMDIEGAEYDVLEKMLKDGSIDAVKAIVIEFHWEHFEADKKEFYRARQAAIVDRLKQKNELLLVEWH